MVTQRNYFSTFIEPYDDNNYFHLDERKRRKSSDSRRKNELLTKNLTKLTNKAFKHISAGKFSEREVRSRFDTPRVSDADSDEFKDNLREI